MYHLKKIVIILLIDWLSVVFLPVVISPRTLGGETLYQRVDNILKNTTPPEEMIQKCVIWSNKPNIMLNSEWLIITYLLIFFFIILRWIKIKIQFW